SRGLGFRGSPDSDTGPDDDPTMNDIDFAISLSSDGHVFIRESGTVVPGPNSDLSFTTYNLGDHFRITLTDKLNGTAEVKYFYCAGAVCEATPLRTASSTATYPLRVDASLREEGARLTDV